MSMLSDPTLNATAGVAVSYLGAMLVKKLSKSKSSLVHKWAAPAVAILSGVGYTVVTGNDADMTALTEGTELAGQAVLLHIGYKLARDAMRAKKGEE